MFRYLTFAWNSADESATAAARVLAGRLDGNQAKWLPVMRQPGIEVRYVASSSEASRAYLLPRGRGVVLGTLFVRQIDQPSHLVNGDLSEPEAQAIVASGGRKLFESYWGRYVAFIRDANRQTSWVLRDPTGGLPCYSCTVDGVTIYFTELDDVIGVRPLSVNWDYVARALCVTGGLQTHETGFHEIGQVLGGECVEAAGQATRSFMWDPWAIAQSTLDDPIQATAAVRRTVADVVHCWASCHSNVLHGVGGLDSAIVAACLASAPSRPRFTCYTYFSQGAGSDERHFARLVARRAGVELIELERTPVWDLEPLLSAARPSPAFQNHTSYIEPSFVEGPLARKIGATAITSGFGGDQLFVQGCPKSALEYAVRHGIGSACWSMALDDACMEGESVWTVLFEVVRAVVFRRFEAPLALLVGNRALMPDHLLSATNHNLQILHPQIRRWIELTSRGGGHKGIASGKILQVHQLLYPPAARNPLAPADDPELISPLYSQPLLELCLRIPTFVHVDRGQDRVIARRAFRDLLPPEVISRWGKGLWEEQAAGLLQHNIRFVRDLLMGGELVRRGLLIRSRIEERLSCHTSRLSISNVEIFDAIFAEAWLRRSLGSRV